jgi:TPR repeat protein
MEHALNQINYGIVQRANSWHSDLMPRLAGPLLACGDASTQWYMGYLQQITGFDNGDMEQPLSWYQKSVAQGFARAQEALRIIGERGLNWFAEDINRVSKCEPRSKEFYDLLSIPRCSRGDCARALKWYCDFAKRGDGEAQIVLGMIYEKGIGVTRDATKALKCYRKASDQGLDEGYNLYEKLYREELKDFRSRATS